MKNLILFKKPSLIILSSLLSINAFANSNAPLGVIKADLAVGGSIANDGQSTIPQLNIQSLGKLNLGNGEANYRSRAEFTPDGLNFLNFESSEDRTSNSRIDFTHNPGTFRVNNSSVGFSVIQPGIVAKMGPHSDKSATTLRLNASPLGFGADKLAYTLTPAAQIVMPDGLHNFPQSTGWIPEVRAVFTQALGPCELYLKAMAAFKLTAAKHEGKVSQNTGTEFETELATQCRWVKALANKDITLSAYYNGLHAKSNVGEKSASQSTHTIGATVGAGF